MYRTSLAQYYAYIENEESKAIDIINDAINMYPKKIYPYLTKLEILNHLKDMDEIECTIDLIEKRFDKTSEIFRKLQYLIAKCFLWKHKNKSLEMRQILNDIEKNFSQSIYQKCVADLS